MTQEEKQLLLKDLCARLPYGVKCYDTDNDVIFTLNDFDDFSSGFPITNNGMSCIAYCKPYLRPMSSMTRDECEELNKLPALVENIGEILPNAPYYIEVARSETLDWLNSHHFDYRGLIEKGLALEAPKGMYK